MNINREDKLIELVKDAYSPKKEIEKARKLLFPA
jgi:ferritin-like metal-binding protein YciE